MKIHPIGAELSMGMGTQTDRRTDGRTDRQDEPIVTYCNFVNAPKNCAMLIKHSDKLVVSKKISFTAHKNMQLANNNEVYVTTSEIIMTVTMKVTAFWDVMPYTWKKCMAFQRKMPPPSSTMMVVETYSS